MLVLIIIFFFILTPISFGINSYSLAKKIPQSAYLKPILDTTETTSPKLQNSKTYLQGSLNFLI